MNQECAYLFEQQLYDSTVHFPQQEITGFRGTIQQLLLLIAIVGGSVKVGGQHCLSWAF